MHNQTTVLNSSKAVIKHVLLGTVCRDDAFVPDEPDTVSSNRWWENGSAMTRMVSCSLCVAQYQQNQNQTTCLQQHVRQVPHEDLMQKTNSPLH